MLPQVNDFSGQKNHLPDDWIDMQIVSICITLGPLFSMGVEGQTLKLWVKPTSRQLQSSTFYSGLNK